MAWVPDSLKGLTNLSKLDLAYTQVSGAGLAHLRGMINLSELDLGFTQVSDSGLAWIPKVANLANIFRFGLARLPAICTTALIGLVILR
jgi:Leucine-rich repeat (LRR) protein